MADLSLGFGDDPKLPDIQNPANFGSGLSLGAPDEITTAPWEGLAARSSLENAIGAPQTPDSGQAPDAGLGLAQVSNRTPTDQEYLQSLSMSEKIGLALQSFGAGYFGQESPIDKLLDRKHKRDAQARQDLVTTINVLQKGSEILRKLPAGTQRQAVARELGKAVGPQFSPVLEAAGTDRDEALQHLLSVIGDDDAQKYLLKLALASDDPKKEFFRLISDDSASKTAEKIVADKLRPGITQKMITVRDEFKRIGKEEFTVADLELANSAAAKSGGQPIFTPQEMRVIKGDEAHWGDMGLKGRKAVEAGQTTAARDEARGERTPALGTLQTITVNGVQKQQRFAGVDEETGTLKWEDVGVKPAKTGEKKLTPKQELDAKRQDGNIVASREAVERRLASGKTLDGLELMAGVNPAIKRELDAARKQTRAEIESGAPAWQAAVTKDKPKAEAKPAPAAKSAPTVRSKADFDALPKGAEFIDGRDGKRKVKG